MTDTNPSRTALGRPRRSSRDTLQDAACELFLEVGYERTTVDEIARRAGVSRASFFNYFRAKSDVLWADVDPALAELPRILELLTDRLPPTVAVRAVLVEVAALLPVAPAALVERATTGAAAEAAVAGLDRMLMVRVALRRYLSGRSTAPAEALDGFAAAATAVAASAGVAWLDAGSARQPLADAVDAALAPVCAGYAPLLD
ncbi:MAG TPA: helix-turn-helix domain-containing protein [Naasia sp.]